MLRYGRMDLKKIDFSKIHDCDKCHGKIVMIAVNESGQTFCSYCMERVPYDEEIKKQIPDIEEQINKAGGGNNEQERS